MSDAGRDAYYQEQTAIDETSPTIETAIARLQGLEQQTAELDAEPDQPLIDLWYAKMLVWVLFDGLIGESAALLGAVNFGLGPAVILRALTFVAATAILLMLGLMAQAAWLRYRQGNLNPRGPLLIAIILLLTGAAIIVAIFFGGPTAKAQPRPAPSSVKINHTPATNKGRQSSVARRPSPSQ